VDNQQPPPLTVSGYHQPLTATDPPQLAEDHDDEERHSLDEASRRRQALSQEGIRKTFEVGTRGLKIR
jgi:hypothetical protein